MGAEENLDGESGSGQGTGEARGAEATQERRAVGEKKAEGEGEGEKKKKDEGEGTVNSTHSSFLFIPHFPYACGLLPFTLTLWHQRNV